MKQFFKIEKLIDKYIECVVLLKLFVIENLLQWEIRCEIYKFVICEFFY